MCKSNRLLLLAFVCLAWCLLAPAATWSAEVMVEQKSSDDTTSQPLPGSPIETLPTPSWDDFDKLLTELEQESAKLSAELATISDKLTRREQQVKELESDLQASAVRIATLERTMNTERAGAETAIASALEQKHTAEKERDFWRVGGISCATVAVIVFVLSLIF